MAPDKPLDTAHPRHYKPPHPNEDVDAAVSARSLPLAESPNSRTDDDALRDRLAALDRSLDADKGTAPERPPLAEDKTLAGAMSLGARVLTEFVAGIAVGALIGWQLDKWLHTSPVLLIVFLALGTAAGFWNVYRIAAKPTGSRGPL